ncbi:MAG: glycosyltransferase [Flavobacteriales bacterium]|nr:glycosyltransferase [Flavobacteriales bacterium]
MRILQLCNKPPFPPIDGGSKAMYDLTRGLIEARQQVKVVCITTPKHDLDTSGMPSEIVEKSGIEGVFVDTSLNVVDAFADLITADNYNISRFFSPDMDIRLIRLLAAEQFDVVLLESLFMAPYIPTIRRYSDARVVLRSHNLEHVIQERIATGEKNILKRPYRRFLARQLKNYEMEVLDRVDAVAAISPVDRDNFLRHGTRTPIATIPFGVVPADYDTTPAKGPLTFFHLGSMDWLPNEEGVHWLVDQVWPRLLRKQPKARLHLAGNRMPRDLIARQTNGLQIKGRVKDAGRYMAERHVMVVPLFSAGGMRVKIIEGMAMGKCVISTPIGAEGIEATHDKDILIARNMTEFVEQMDRVLREPDLATRIGTQARHLIEQRYDTRRIVKDLITFLKGLQKA